MNANKIIDDIEKVRSRNNSCWMQLLKLALKVAPKEVADIFKNITTNDAKINKLSKMLGE